MTIKNFFKVAPFLIFIAFAIPQQSMAFVKIPTPVDSTANTQMLSNIISRVTEIQNMDKSNLSASEKKELKKELREMKRKADGARQTCLSFCGRNYYNNFVVDPYFVKKN